MSEPSETPETLRDIFEQRSVNDDQCCECGNDLYGGCPNCYRQQITTLETRLKAALAECAHLREDKERMFPMQCGPAIPWSVAEIIYAGYSALYGTNQSLQRMAERGGFGWAEVSQIYAESRGRKAMEDAARKEGK